MPLVASLHAYRIAHRTYSDISQDALSQRGAPGDILCAQRMLYEFWIEFFDHVGHVLADAHAAEDALIVAQENPRPHAPHGLPFAWSGASGAGSAAAL